MSYVGDLGSPSWQVSAALFGSGVGVGLTLDEYALFLHLDDVYWADEGRSSIDAAVVALVIAGLVVLGARPFAVDPGGAVWPTVVYTVVDLGFALVTFAKKRLFLGVPANAIGIWCACRIAKPSSDWAHRFYTDDTERRRGKLVTARPLPARPLDTAARDPPPGRDRWRADAARATRLTGLSVQLRSRPGPPLLPSREPDHRHRAQPAGADSSRPRDRFHRPREKHPTSPLATNRRCPSGGMDPIVCDCCWSDAGQLDAHAEMRAIDCD